jgi:uncharacterized membrane protein
MKLNISRDARPQVGTLLIAALLSIALWFIPYASFLAYPFRIFVTFIHEGAHALAALLTGNSVRSLSVAMDTSGLTETYVAQGSRASQMFISSAGYLGAMLFGALLLVLIRRAVAARVVLISSAVYILALTLIYGLFVPLTYFSFSPFTIVSGILISAGLLASARYLSARAASFLVSFLAVQCVLNAIFDLKNVLFISVASADSLTDAKNMAGLFGIWPLTSSIFWAIIWIGLSVLILSTALRFYAVSRNRAGSQPDLPFEEPLDI